MDEKSLFAAFFTIFTSQIKKYYVQKLVAIEPVSLVLSAEKALYSLQMRLLWYLIFRRGIMRLLLGSGDADAVLLSYTSQINRYILERCPNVRYIGMCCSLYSPESANVDIRYANERGITVTGIRDYGDEGVSRICSQRTGGVVFMDSGQKPWGRDSPGDYRLESGYCRLRKIWWYDSGCNEVFWCGYSLLCP